MRQLLVAAIAAGAVAAAPTASSAQVEPRTARFWEAAAGGVVAGALMDGVAREYATTHGGTALGRAAAALGPAGRAAFCVPALAGSYLVAWASGRRPWKDAVLEVAAGYVAADAAESVLKSAVGRQRPYVAGDRDAFHPFSGRGEYHSFPSAHTVHAMSLAAGIAEEVHRPVVAVLVYSAAGLVAAQRVYGDWHWTSDVAASTVLAIVASRTTIGAVRRWRGSADGTTERAAAAPAREASRGRALRLQVDPSPAGLRVRLTF